MTTQIMRLGLYVSCAVDHVVRFARPSPSVFAYCKRSKTGAGEGLGTRLERCSNGMAELLATPGSCMLLFSQRVAHCQDLSSALLHITIGSVIQLSTPCSKVIYLSASVLSTKPHTHEQSFVAKC